MEKRSIETFIQAAAPRLQRLYGANQAPLLLDEITSLLQSHRAAGSAARCERWDQEDVILISYGDSIRTGGEAPLRTLGRFLREHLEGLISTVHILPFFPFSSDDGFSVIDYAAVDPELGDWKDIAAIRQDFDLMIDLVINHVSRESLWFIDFINNRPPACYYFIEMDPQVDLSDVVRPRQSKVLTPVHTHRGLKHVWSTFSEDQIDLNFANPNVLLEFVRILLLYLRRGGRFIRLDAIAYLWKKLGTSCINLEQTHEIVKLLREVMDAAAPDAVLLTETNLPHAQNHSYYGDGDEAHMVYQFSLAPLLLHALHRGTSRYLNEWARNRCTAPEGCTFLNFTASHDGIGLRPAEGLIPQSEIEALIESMHGFGGYVSMKSNPDGSNSPYEINISYFDALQGTAGGRDQWQVPRFLASQTVMLAIKGIPALYVQSLIASPNDLEGVEKTGRTRSINRRKWDYGQLSGLIRNPYTPNNLVFHELRRLLAIRRQQPAFHPDAGQEILALGDAFFGVRRLSASSEQEILAISNLTEWPQRLCLQPQTGLSLTDRSFDLIGNGPVTMVNEATILQPYQTLWLAEKQPAKKVAKP
ncbi:sugar phosphorylase [uncultured Desulfuromonas sp.]|uniref:sugar phosphorylase n=1 Tax=uncultured Desulfuromonas sp. TaxID=181013 RepID=UPI002630531C|nr:sugar phosphorylase [uncultured Desulfuromonas sp.]